MKKVNTTGLPTAADIRLIAHCDDGGWNLNTFKAEFAKLKRRIGSDSPFEDMVMGIEHSLSVIDFNLKVATNPKVASVRRRGRTIKMLPDIKAVADCGILAGLRYLALRTMVDFAQGGRKRQTEIFEIMRRRYVENPDLSEREIAEDAIKEFREFNSDGYQTPLCLNYLCKVFKKEVTAKVKGLSTVSGKKRIAEEVAKVPQASQGPVAVSARPKNKGKSNI